jgi:hypothetical protein
VSPDPSHDLSALLRRRLVELLTATADALQATLDGLAAQSPSWPQPAVQDHLLTPLDSAAPADPVAAAVVSLLTGSLRAPEGDASLHGWSAAAGQPRGVAYALRAGGNAGDLAVALATDETALRLVASGSAAAATVLLGAGWTVTLGGGVTGTLDIRIPPDGDLEATGTPGDSLTVSFHRAAPAAPDVGADPGPAVRFGQVEALGTVSIRQDGTPVFTGSLRITDGSIALAPGGFAGLVPGLGPVPLALELAADPGSGVTLGGSTTLATTIPLSASLPGVSAGPLEVALTLGAGTSIGIRVRARLALDLPGVPIRVDAQGIGLSVPFALGDGGRIGLDPGALVPVAPDGAGVELALPVVTGAGTVRHVPSGEYSGLLALTIPPMSAQAFGVLHLDPFSFLVILSATFPPPGVQIGFGFAVTGVGGIVGVGRRVDAQDLAQAVVSGTIADLLFPVDPEKHADRVVAALPAIFPPAPGRVVVGPMFQVSWGGRLISLSAALVLELPAPVRITLLGRLQLAIPDPTIPLVDIQVTFVGQVDTGEPSVWFLASLAASSIVGVPLTGDLYLLSRGGDDPQFLLSAGGFHPAYVPPRGVPALHRIGIDLGSGFLQLRAQAYFAVTSNTIQFGARLDLVAEVAGCGLHGFLGFDVLVQLEPFHFQAQISGGIAVEVASETLAGISLSLALDGPAPWHAIGRGSVDLFLFSVSFDFELTWGDPAPPRLATPDVAGILQQAFAARDAWTAAPPDLSRSPVQLSAAARKALADGTAVHPHGRVAGRQRRVPLGITLQRFDRVPIAPQRWDLADPVLAPGVPAQSPAELRDEFAAASYLSLSDDEELGRPAFEPYRAGLAFSSGDMVVGEARDTNLSWETSTIDDTPLVNLDMRLGSLTGLLGVASAATVNDPGWWQVPASRVVETGAQFVPADTWALSVASDLVPPGRTAAEAHQAAEAADPLRRVRVVESWEVGV